jgi:hypothetical protein
MARRRLLGLAALVVLAPLTIASCVGATSSQNPPGVTVDASTPAESGQPFNGTCDTSTTWQVALSGASGGGTLTFEVPASDTNGGSWTPTPGLTYSFDASTCTVTLASQGCAGIGTFDLSTRTCHLLTEATCSTAPCDAGCPTQSTTCVLSAL